MTARICAALSFAGVAAVFLTGAVQPSAYAVLGFFGSGPGDGYELYAPVIFGSDGALYGTTTNGGTVVKPGACRLGCGTVFRLDQSGRHATLHDFSGGDGELPVGPLLLAADGQLYGTTTQGEGAAQGGTIFSLATDGSGFHVVHRFDGEGGNANPQGALVEYSDGFLYGTTIGGAPVRGSFPAFAYRIRPDGSGYTVLHTFFIDTSGGAPTDGVLPGSDGRLSGTTGKSTGNVAQTIFSMNLDGSDYRVLHVLSGGSIFYESPGLIEPMRGTLYGVEVDGTHRGLLYSLALDGSHFRVLHRFAGNGGGAEPMGRLVLGLDGDLYGTTFDGAKGGGTLFALHLDGTGFRVIHTFGSTPRDGRSPRAGLTIATDGTLIGTTQEGGRNRCPPFAGCGTVFMSKP